MFVRGVYGGDLVAKTVVAEEVEEEELLAGIGGGERKGDSRCMANSWPIELSGGNRVRRGGCGSYLGNS